MWWCLVYFSALCSHKFILHARRPIWTFPSCSTLNWRGEDTDSQQAVILIYRRRIMSSKDAEVPHTADSGELAHAPSYTAVNHKLGQVSLVGSWTNLRALYGTPPKMILSHVFSSQPFHQAITALDLRGRHATEGNSTKSTNHQQGIIKHPI